MSMAKAPRSLAASSRLSSRRFWTALDGGRVIISTPGAPLVVILLALLLTSLRAQGAGSDGQSADVISTAGCALTAGVRSSEDFVRALEDPRVFIINVEQDLLMPEERWPPAMIRLERNVTIQSVPGGPQRLMNFTLVKNKVALSPGVHLMQRNVIFVGATTACYQSYIANSPGAYLWVRDGVSRVAVCPSAYSMVTIISIQPRPAAFPGYQQMHAIRWWEPRCARGRCFFLGLVVTDIRTATVPTSLKGTGSSEGPYTVVVVNITYLCDVGFTDACIAKRGYMPCREDAIERFKQGESLGYNERWKRAAEALIALACVGIATCVMRVLARQSTPAALQPRARLRKSSATGERGDEGVPRSPRGFQTLAKISKGDEDAVLRSPRGAAQAKASNGEDGLLRSPRGAAVAETSRRDDEVHGSTSSDSPPENSSGDEERYLSPHGVAPSKTSRPATHRKGHHRP